MKHAMDGRVCSQRARSAEIGRGPIWSNRSGDSRWVPDPSVPVMGVSEKPKARSASICAPTLFYESL